MLDELLQSDYISHFWIPTLYIANGKLFYVESPYMP